MVKDSFTSDRLAGIVYLVTDISSVTLVVIFTTWNTDWTSIVVETIIFDPIYFLNPYPSMALHLSRLKINIVSMDIFILI